jgi:DNA-binding IclR family transcriptional regulator
LLLTNGQITSGIRLKESIKNDASGTVARTVRILRFIGECKTTTIREASAVLKLAPSTVHRLFDLLGREGIIEQDRSSRSYRAGPEFFRIAAQVVAEYDLRMIALPIMREVAAACEEACVFGLYLPAVHRMTLAEKVDSPLPLRYQLPLNTQLSLLSGASGRSILALLPRDLVDTVLREQATARAPGTALWPRAKLLRELKIIREQGFATSHGEMIAGATAIAAPVIGASGNVIGSLGVTAPDERMQTASVRRISVLVRKMADNLSDRLGAPDLKPPPTPVGVAPTKKARERR